MSDAVMDRWARVLGYHPSPYVVAEMVGVSFSQVYRWTSANKWPELPMLILHTLEHVPRRYWPDYLKARLDEAKKKR